jgi:hypothetical protein
MGDEVKASDAADGFLHAARNDDGGFGPRPGTPSEPEPTALAAIALDDDDARAWLAAHQRGDGSFGLVDGFVRDEAATGLAAIALDAGPARDRALDRLEELRGARAELNEHIPVDVDLLGWPWTRDSFGWVEPTSRALLALRLVRPSSTRIAEGVDLLRDRRAVGGGWNYGNRVVLGQELPPFAHTTAVALLALHGLDAELEDEGTAALHRLWREERTGALSVATALAVFRLRGESDRAAEAAAVLDELGEAGAIADDTVATAWAAIATGPGLQTLGAP